MKFFKYGAFVFYLGILFLGASSTAFANECADLPDGARAACEQAINDSLRVGSASTVPSSNTQPQDETSEKTNKAIDVSSGTKGYRIELREALGEGAGSTVIEGNNGFDIISSYIALIYKFLAGIIGIICVAFIVVSGVQIIMGGASSQMVDQAKTRIIQSILSLVLLFGLSLLLSTVNPHFFPSGGLGGPSSGLF